MNTEERAPVVEEENPHTGKTRLRCSCCGKIAFSSREEAESAAQKIALRGVVMQAYKGRRSPEEAPDPRNRRRGLPCGWWHLFIKKQRRAG